MWFVVKVERDKSLQWSVSRQARVGNPNKLTRVASSGCAVASPCFVVCVVTVAALQVAVIEWRGSWRCPPGSPVEETWGFSIVPGRPPAATWHLSLLWTQSLWLGPDYAWTRPWKGVRDPSLLHDGPRALVLLHSWWWLSRFEQTCSLKVMAVGNEVTRELMVPCDVCHLFSVWSWG